MPRRHLYELIFQEKFDDILKVREHIPRDLLDLTSCPGPDDKAMDVIHAEHDFNVMRRELHSDPNKADFCVKTGEQAGAASW